MKQKFKKILRSLNIEPQEAVMVMLLLVQSVFLGIFFGSFETCASTIFLGNFSENMLGKGFMVSGVAGIILTSLYTYLQDKIAFNKLTLLNLLFITSASVILWLGYSVQPGEFWAFTLLVMMGPLNILAMVGFWGTAVRIFNLRQGKRLFGLIDSGQIIGVILSNFAIPVFLTFGFKTKDLLLISSIGCIIALIFQIWIVFKAKVLAIRPEKNIEKEKTSFKTLFKNKFTRLMAIFIALSMVIAFFISYSLLAVSKAKYPDMDEFAKFLGAFMGTVMIFTLLIKTLVYGKFMKSYGLKVALIISPVILGLLTLIATITGVAGAYAAASAGFIFFFLLISLSRLFSITLKSSIEAPSFKILYQTVDSKIRHQVQSQIDGTVNEVSALSAGIFLAILGLFSFIIITHYLYILLFLLAVWGVTAYKLYYEYQRNLNNSLAKLGTDDNNTTLDAGRSLISIENIRIADTVSITKALTIQQKVQPLIFEKDITNLAKNAPEPVKAAIANVTRLHHKNNAVEKLIQEYKDSVNYERILNLIRSRNIEDRILAARLIEGNPQDEYIPVLKTLFRDFDNEVKKAAIKASLSYINPEFCPLIIEFLTSDKLSSIASDVLIAKGQTSIEYLENSFSKASSDLLMMQKITRIIGEIGHEKAIKSLVSKINYHHAEIAYIAADMLCKHQYRFKEDNYYILQQALVNTMHIIAWDISARLSLSDSQGTELLLNAINYEIKRNTDHLFTLLSLSYDVQTIKHIRQNIENESVESSGYAIELLDLIVAEEIKPMLFPLIEDTSDTEKIRQLQFFFPIDKQPLNKLYINIINKDYNQINIWTKASVLYLILESETFEITDDIIAQLFNQDPLLSELAVSIIQKFTPEKLNKYLKRVPIHDKKRILESISKYCESIDNLLYKRIAKLHNSGIFKNIPCELIYPIAYHFTEVKVSDASLITLTDEDNNELIYYILEGKIANNKNDVFEQGTLFGPLFNTDNDENTLTFASSGQSSLLKMKQEQFEHILLNYPDISEYLVNEFIYKAI